MGTLSILLSSFLVSVYAANTIPAPVATPTKAVTRPVVVAKTVGAKKGQTHAIAPKQARVTPVKGQFQPIVLGAPPASEKHTAAFFLQQSQGKLFLVFKPKDAAMQLKQDGRLAVQINSPDGIEVSPAVVLASAWPKGASQLQLNVTGGVPGQVYSIAGKASYQLCHLQTKACKKEFGLFRLEFRR